MRTVGLKVAVWVGLAVLGPVAIASAETEGRFAKPSVEELAIPQSRATGEQAADDDTREAMCLMIESAARAQDLPLEFFARVIWQESRFQSDAVGPVTRSGQRAQGIAQFMPGTASERRLLDPFDPVQALPKSAEFLSELRDQFGNLGLAAAAYNAGPRRVQEWLAGTGDDAAGDAQLRGRHHRHARSTTGRPPAKPARCPTARRPRSCRELMALLRRAPNPFVTQLEQHVKLGDGQAVGRAARRGF